MKKDWSLLVGEKHGTLTVKQVAGSDRNGFTYLLCQCDCGNEKVVKATDFTRWKVKTCGKLECKRKTRGVFYERSAEKYHANTTWSTRLKELLLAMSIVIRLISVL